MFLLLVPLGWTIFWAKAERQWPDRDLHFPILASGIALALFLLALFVIAGFNSGVPMEMY